MNSIFWIIDKFIDLLAPQLYLKLKAKWKKNPKTSFCVLVILITVFSLSAKVLDFVLYMPVSFFNDDRPLRAFNSSRANAELKHIDEHLISEAGIFVESGPNISNNRDFDAWTYANILVALGPNTVSSRLKQDHLQYFQKWMKPFKTCWAEYGKLDGPCHIGATSWVLVAMSVNSLSPTREMWEYLLKQQNKFGWWSLYEDSGGDLQNASTYSTAVALWALDTGLKTNTIPEELITKSKISLERARSWLFSKRTKGDCLWSAYPDRISDVEPSLAISAFVVHALLSSGVEPIKSINHLCLNSLLAEKPVITEMYTTGENVRLNDGKTTEKDAVRHQKLILTILALDKMYPIVSFSERGRIRRFIESTLFLDDAPVESKLDYSWQKAELALALKSILY
jgi:hypothetical protein